jgi:hypothetical protein
MNKERSIKIKHVSLPKSKLIRLCSLLLVLCSLSLSAQQQWYFSVDERYPAERGDLKNSPRVLVVNNALMQPQDFGHTVMVDGENKGGVEVDLSNSVLYSLFSCTQSMDGIGDFEAVELMDISQNSSTNYYVRQKLTHDRAEQLCADYQADALLILNQLVLYDVLESFPTDGGTYYAYLQAYAQSHWTIHYAGQSRERSFSQADTLLWECSQTHYTRARSLAELPSRQEALLYLAQEVGYRVGSSFAPSWRSTRRYIYEKEELLAGLSAFRYQKWEDAIVRWKEVMGPEDEKIEEKVKGNKKAAACAAANIAIAYEMLGDYVSACDYAQRAIRLFGAWKTAYGRQQQANIRYYLAHLQARQARERAQ